MPHAAGRPALAANLALAAGALFLALFVLAILEASLRVAGAGEPDPLRPSRLAYQRIALPILVPGRLADGRAVLRTADPRLPVQWVDAHKEPGALRVFLFGSSAAAGLGFSPNVTIARELERLLVRALPGRRIEVMNLGIVALAARQARQILEDVCRSAEPDLLVVYSGNNEFLELHAERYAAATGGVAFGLAEALRDTNLFRVLAGALRGAPATPSLAQLEQSREALRLTQDAIVEKIETREADVAAISAGYAEQLSAMADAAEAAQARLVLMRVASNWRWRGREDLAPDWVESALPDTVRELADTEKTRAAIAELERRLQAATRFERGELRFQSAVLHEALGDNDAARRDYRLAMNEDRHLRRALDELGDALARVAAERGAIAVDTVAALAADAPHAIVGFEHFYDYVHFTPRGAAVAAAALFGALADARVIEPSDDFDLGAARVERLSAIASTTRDPIEVEDWQGFGFELRGIADRDLWKYDRRLAELDRRIETDPRDAMALAYRCNARSFRSGELERARSDCAAAIAAGGSESALRANLERLSLREDF
jgi:hypothetical protein